MASLRITKSTLNGRTVYKVNGKFFYTRANAAAYVRKTGHSASFSTKKSRSRKGKTKKPMMGRLHAIDREYVGVLDNPYYW